VAQYVSDNSVRDNEAMIHKLNNIGIRLSAEKNIHRTFMLILDECMEITNSDGGSIYIHEADETGDWLTIKYARNFSRSFPFKEYKLPFNSTSFAGYCGTTGKSLNFANVEESEKAIGIRHNDVFDRANTYRTVNMLVIPMKNYAGDIIGVLQLLNRKMDRDIVLKTPEDFETRLAPYSLLEEEIITSLASQTAILLERAWLYEELDRSFRTFIESLVMALDKRDPITTGHSKRVADNAVALAQSLNVAESGLYAWVHLNENRIRNLYYAGLLHDIGKVGIEEYLLKKNCRLNSDKMNAIRYKFHFLKHHLYLKDVSEELNSGEKYQFNALDDWLTEIERINTLGLLEDGDVKLIEEIAGIEFGDIDGLQKPLLSEYEREALSVRGGLFTSEERKQLERHPALTFEVLQEIQWGSELKEIPHLAAYHHDPTQKEDKEAALMTKILELSDLFDVLGGSSSPENIKQELYREVNLKGIPDALVQLLLEIRMR